MGIVELTNWQTWSNWIRVILVRVQIELWILYLVKILQQKVFKHTVESVHLNYYAYVEYSLNVLLLIFNVFKYNIYKERGVRY